MEGQGLAIPELGTVSFFSKSAVMTSVILKHVYSAFSLATGARNRPADELRRAPAPAAEAQLELQRRILTATFHIFLVTLFFSISAMEIAAWSLVGTILVVTVSNKLRGLSSPTTPSFSIGCERLLLLFFCWVTVSALVRVPLLGDKWDVISETRWIVVLYGLTFFIRSQLSERSEKLLLFIAPLFIFVGIYATIQFVTGMDLLLGRHEFLKPFGASTYRAVGFFGMPLTFAYSFGLLGSAFTMWYFFRFSSLTAAGRWLGGIAVLCILAGVFASGVRGAWLATGVTAASILPFLNRRTAFLSIACVIAMVAALIIGSESFRLRFVTIVQVREPSNAGRVKIWRGHLAMARDYPILGVGLGQTGKHLGKYYDKLGIRRGQIGHAHNNFIEYLAGTGIVGLTFYVLLCLFFLRASLLAYRRHTQRGAPPAFLASLAIGCFAAQIYLHTGGLTEVNFTDGEVNHALIFVWALTISINTAPSGGRTGFQPVQN